MIYIFYCIAYITYTLHDVEYIYYTYITLIIYNTHYNHLQPSASAGVSATERAPVLLSCLARAWSALLALPTLQEGVQSVTIYMYLYMIHMYMRTV